ncbi:MAG: class 1 fructose-bisphosphatase [bacterium]
MNNDIYKHIKKGIDLRRHISITQREYPEATGEFSQLLGQLTLAAKIVSREVNKAGLGDILGKTDDENVYGERQARLDLYANAIFSRALIHNGGICIIGSEEESDPVRVRKKELRGKYAVTIDPLDGSSNIDYGVSIGTIFGIYRKISKSEADSEGTLEDLLQPGRDLVAAGYVIYGSSTMLVYSAGKRVYGFTLDSSIGEFLLSHPNIQIPEKEGYLSVNESYFTNWAKPVREALKALREDHSYTSRYIGSMVADFHRNLLAGGIFLYPPEPNVPGKDLGKLRLLYEAAPMAFIADRAGGRASNGYKNILDIKPKHLHHRTPFYVGNTKAVELIEKKFADFAPAEE